MGLLDPAQPHWDPRTWPDLPFAERARLACEDWALRGFGVPAVGYAFYVLKLAAYIAGFLWIASATPALGGVADWRDWWATPLSLQKAALWTMLWEGLGLGAGSGPLTARYLPPVTAFVHFLWRGTTRLPPWPVLPGTSGHLRTVLDVGLYAGAVLALGAALAADALGTTQLVPILAFVLLLGLRDRTAFLAFRSEHYLTVVVIGLFPADVLPGLKFLLLALWFGAASSKLNHIFPTVVAVMLSNSPVHRLQAFRRRLYRSFPDDLRPSSMATTIAHAGTVVEYGFPILLLTTSGTARTVALLVMVGFHLNIIGSMPAGVPIEWNVLFIFTALALFGEHAEVSVLDVQSPLLAVLLLAALVVVPVLGNLFPARISFLPSMRYYAGNWPWSIWLFRPEALASFEDRVQKVAPDVVAQAQRLYDDDVVTTLVARALAFRSMHLPGRALQVLLPLAVADAPGEAFDDRLSTYLMREGEIVGGVVLGWNFGDGHLHQEQLMAALQAQCDFAPGDVRGIFVESHPIHRPVHHWRIVDAHDGLLHEGDLPVADLRRLQPWPTDVTASIDPGVRP